MGNEKRLYQKREYWLGIASGYISMIMIILLVLSVIGAVIHANDVKEECKTFYGTAKYNFVTNKCFIESEEFDHKGNVVISKTEIKLR